MPELHKEQCGSMNHEYFCAAKARSWDMDSSVGLGRGIVMSIFVASAVIPSPLQ